MGLLHAARRTGSTERPLRVAEQHGIDAVNRTSGSGKGSSAGAAGRRLSAYPSAPLIREGVISR